jgi:hypothetical protein
VILPYANPENYLLKTETVVFCKTREDVTDIVDFLFQFVSHNKYITQQTEGQTDREIVTELNGTYSVLSVLSCD